MTRTWQRVDQMALGGRAEQARMQHAAWNGRRPDIASVVQHQHAHAALSGRFSNGWNRVIGPEGNAQAGAYEAAAQPAVSGPDASLPADEYEAAAQPAVSGPDAFLPAGEWSEPA